MYNVTMDRFWNKVNKTNTCWLWTAGKTNTGYGRFNYLNKTRAHQVSWILKHGLIPNGLQINHKEDICSNKHCINPEHLYLGTQKQNVEDMARNKNHGQQKKNHCKNGHEFTLENTGYSNKTTKTQQRYCKECKRKQTREWHKNKRKFLKIEVV